MRKPKNANPQTGTRTTGRVKKNKSSKNFMALFNVFPYFF
jgi:hypothetical protein